jgi:hypothetical protein
MMNRQVSFIPLFFLLILFSFSTASSVEFSEVKHMDIPTDKVILKDGYLYGVDGMNIVVIDISDINSPMKLFEGEVLDVDIAYVADMEIAKDCLFISGRDTISPFKTYVVDVSDPMQPKYIGDLEYADSLSLGHYTDYFYRVRDGYLDIFDTSNISDINSIQKLGKIDDVGSILVSNGVLYGVRDGNIFTCDLRYDPLNLEPKMSSITCGLGIIEDNYLYTSSGGYTLKVIDISDKTNLVEVFSSEDLLYQHDFYGSTVLNDYLYVPASLYNGDTQVFNIKERDNPIFEQTVDLGSIFFNDGTYLIGIKENSVSGYKLIFYEVVPTGSLSIISSPSESDVYIDGKYVGNTPTTVDDINLGVHEITLKSDGYFDKSLTVTIEDGKNKQVSQVLESKNQDETYYIEEEQQQQHQSMIDESDLDEPTITVSREYIDKNGNDILESGESVKVFYGAGDTYGIKNIKLYIDDVLVETKDVGGDFEFQTDSLSEGNHQIKIEAIDVNSNVATEEIHVYVNSINPTVNFRSTVESIDVGETAIFTLAAVNPIGNPP